MFNGIFRVPQPVNEPVLSYAPGTSERAEIQAKLSDLLSVGTEVPMIIGGQEVKNGSLANMICPHDHQHVLGQYHQANALFVEQAIEAADRAKPQVVGHFESTIHRACRVGTDDLHAVRAGGSNLKRLR